MARYLSKQIMKQARPSLQPRSVSVYSVIDKPCPRSLRPRLEKDDMQDYGLKVHASTKLIPDNRSSHLLLSTHFARFGHFHSFLFATSSTSEAPRSPCCLLPLHFVALENHDLSPGVYIHLFPPLGGVGARQYEPSSIG